MLSAFIANNGTEPAFKAFGVPQIFYVPCNIHIAVLECVFNIIFVFYKRICDPVRKLNCFLIEPFKRTVNAVLRINNDFR